MGIHAILLAAGASTRMGAPKQLIDVNGRSLIRHMAKLALQSKIDGLSVVLGAYRENLLPELINLPLNTIINPDWDKGMGTSLKAAMDNVDKEQEGVLIMVCDQPYLTVEILDSLIRKAERNPNSIIASSYQEAIGTPAIFNNVFFGQLKQITNEVGAKSLLKKHAEQVITVSFPNGDFDLDTPEDLVKWKNS